MTPYATLAELTAYLDISVPDDDVLLEMLLNNATAMVDAQTGRTFAASEDDTRYFGSEAIRGMALWLDDDLCAVTSIVNGDGTIIPPTAYRTIPRNQTPWYALELRMTAACAWDAQTDDIAITGKWAYSVRPPADIVQATLRLAAWLYRQRENSSGDLDRALVVGNATVLPARLPSDITQLLMRYRRHI